MDKKPVNVYWVSYHDDVIARGYWDNGLLEYIFEQGEYIHHEVHCTEFPAVELNDGGIFIINGRTHVEDVDKINADIAKLRWVVFIDTGDEEAVFKWEEIKHPLIRMWVMMPRLNRHNDVSFKLPNGFRPNTRSILKEIGYRDKTQDWFFSGQITHERRFQCKQELKYLINSGEFPNGTMKISNGFGDEVIPYNEYLEHMAKTKIVLCPSGPESPDSFRLYEALEAGCLPVVDAFSTNNKTPGFWTYMFGEDPPFPVLDYWDKLPKIMPELIKGYPENANKCFAWWQNKKRQIRLKLEHDIKDISK